MTTVECAGSSSCVTLLLRVGLSVAESAIDLSPPGSEEHSRSRSGIVAGEGGSTNEFVVLLKVCTTHSPEFAPWLVSECAVS